ncbi:MAG: menaquinone biosynthesis protein [Chlamydiia bacterium]|nr:menaquinone biosynthesis protein [Chlamydiia bacterium]
MLSIGLITYSNALPIALPLYGHKIRHTCRCLLGTPSEVYAKLKSGEVDAAIVSSGALVDAPSAIRPLGHIGIAAKGSVQSVCLFSERSPELLHHPTFALPTASGTSSLLLKVLCHSFWGIEPHFISYSQEEGGETTCDGKLLIGDPCMRFAQQYSGITIDLAEEWKRQTALPFVFAQLAINTANGVDPDKVIALFSETLKWSENHLDEIEKEAAEKLPFLNRQQISNYMNGLSYRLDSGFEEGLALFTQLAATVHKL